MNREYINPPDVAAPPSGLYNHVVKVGNTVYISGQVSRGIDGRAIHPGGANTRRLVQSGESGNRRRRLVEGYR